MTPPVACPRCGAVLPQPGADADEARCEAGHAVPVVAGILDCRPALVGFDVEEDRRRAIALSSMRGSGFEELLRWYWASVPAMRPELAERFVTGDLIGAERAGEVADQIEAETGSAVRDEWTVLEVGAGTAALGAALAERAGSVVVTDVSLAWLVLARARLEARGAANVSLVAATADRLPFGPEAFDLVVAADVIEHVPDAEAMVRCCYGALRPGGWLWLSTPNRFSLTPEPHVRLWGVGLLPRPLAVRLVRRLRGIDYGDIATLSAPALRRVLARTGGRVGVCAPPIARAVRDTYAAPARALIDGYHLARRTPGVRQALLAVAPLFHASLHKVDDAR